MTKPRTKKKSARGGIREGSGRPARYGEPLVDWFSVRLNAEQMEAIVPFCKAKLIAPAMLLREVALARAGLSELGIGLEAAYGTLSAAKAEALKTVACQLPVKCTERQADGVRAFCESKKTVPGVWLREVVLEHIGRGELGIRGEVAALEASL